MCDVCTDLLVLLETFEERSQAGGFHLNKREILALVLYVCIWPQRQCMCCFKDYRNFEKINSIVQDALIVGIRLIQTLPEDNEKEIKEGEKKEKVENEGENDSKKKDGEEQDGKKNEENQKEEEKVKEKDGENKDKPAGSADDMETEDGSESWTIDEKERLLQFVTKVFLMNFPSYMAYKHVVHSSLEELSTQETSALNNYCEISDPEVPLFLLRNVCFFCDTNGIGALKTCFEKATPETLPFNFAHLLITLIANLRLWMNIPTVMQYIIPLRTAVIRYMCKLSDKDLRMAGNRNMTDLMWAAVKEPLETHFNFDKDGLELAFKYFTCSTLTIRLAGIAQINNQITLYNESCNNESLMDAERVGHHLAQWLIDYKIIEHIFGPNLHVELIKQSQIILNFLAVEGRVTNEHVDNIWAAAQLKHCGKQVFDTLIPLIKNLELQPVQHLLGLVSELDVSAHMESTLYLASALIKCIWNTCAISQSQALAMHQQQLAAMKHEEAMEMEGKKLVHKKTSDDEMAEHREHKKPGTPEEREGETDSSPSKHHVRHKVHKHIEGQDSEELMDSESESIGLPHSDESGEEAEHCGCHGHGVNGQHVHGHHIHGHHGHGHHELHDGSGGSDSDVETSESSEEIHQELTEEQVKALRAKIAKMHHKAAHDHLHHKHVHHDGESSEEMDSEEDEEEIDSELFDSEDEELLKHQRLKRLIAAHNLPTSDNSEVESDFEEDLEYHHAVQQAHLNAAAHRAKQAMLANEERKRRLMKKRLEEGAAGSTSAGGQEEGKKAAEGAQAGSGQDSDTGVVMAAASLLQENEGNPVKKQSDGTEVFDHSDIVRQLQRKQRAGSGFNSENPMSPDRGSCHSSHISNKSEKNMADFEGEELMSDDELSQINAHAHFTHLSNMASMYHTHMPHLLPQRPGQTDASSSTGSEFSYEDVCKPGSTLLWDLVQEDKVNQLPEGLAMDAEKALCSLICFSTDRRIKMKFIEACIDNLSRHHSVVVSLSILPKIFSSFQQYRTGVDTHTITMWAEKELEMMTHFFINLLHYKESHKKEEMTATSLYGHKEQVQVRLLFLTCVFSSAGSPDSFRLNLEQVDTLWSCLALDKDCSDDCLSWFLNQAKSKDHHAMGLETFKHIFLEKMPQLNPESMSMIGLNLFQQLSHLSKITNASCENPLSEDQVSGMDQLWNIALRALNTDVSITAIQFLNSYYINYGNCLLEKEEEFVKRCMESLTKATSDIYKSPETNLLVIQRGLILLKNHLESFRKRYAYHLRNWQIDGKGIVSHQRSLLDKQSTLIRVQLQPAGIGEKIPIEMSSTDLIGELRAEVNRWWESLQKQHLTRQQGEGTSSSSSMLTPILGAMLGDGPMRMITLGQELSSDMDEKTLGEMQFKDMQLVFVSVGSSRPTRKLDGSIPSASLPSPPVDRIPMMLLNQEPYFGQLLTMLEKLSKLDLVALKIESQERWGLQTKARVLSRKVWELLMLLPTNSAMLQGFKSITSGQADDSAIPDWQQLLNTHSPQRLMYSLQIVEGLSRGPKHRRRSMARCGGGDSYQSTESEMSMEGGQAPEDLWSKRFIMKKGLSHMFNIFKSGSLQMKEDEAWSQWEQECLAFLLRLITQFSIDQSDVEAGHDDVFETQESPRKKLKKHKYDKIIIPRLDQSIVAMLPVSSVLEILMKILFDAAVPSDTNQMHAGSWGRSEVVHYSLSFLVSWAFSSDEVRESLCSSSNFDSWLRRLTLEAPEPHVRREACVGLYRLCLGKTAEGKTGYPFLLPILSSLLSFMSDAFKIKPQKNLDVEGSPKEKEPYGPGVKDYFWLACRFVESISKTDASPEADSPVNLNSLAKDISQHILNREYYETRHGYEEDDALIGLLNLGTAVFKHNPPYKMISDAHEFINALFESLFALPSPVKRYLPKCKSQSSRSGAYDLLIELVKGNLDNFKVLHDKMLHQHSKDAHSSYPWDYWPHEDGRSKCGYVGLTNLGATCYMATCMQHLYMIPQARQSVLQAKCCKQTKHEGTLMELQKMFAYLQESERKAYNPRDFCKVYTMDKQPLNTGEQKDMTEFFTDLITKLEEMSPEMKKLVRCLFGGVITNNVVSLDCKHVSRTLEEFYTVRCQVTDMKNLYESLDEVTVKDMLEGDNMYTCSKCQKKVRAEKRACFKKLPKIICFNTMRYTFNMVTMMKEKVNTHFSFPLRLDMSNYMEKNLISSDKLHQDEDEESGFVEKEPVTPEQECFEYELIGVTVHTGTADGGHYYSFIRDKMSKSESGQDKWFLFNDAEVKQFDPSQIATECFGGEMTSKTYDSVTEKFMDFSFEKTNSAYMLFYERCPVKTKEQIEREEELQDKEPSKKFNFELSKELEQWIWQDNMQFLQDKNIIEHTYFDFMWQMCAYIPTTLPKNNPLAVSSMASQLSTSFVLETFIHAKEKPTMVQWIELLTKQFNSCQAACEWFLDHMAKSDWWPQQILIKCPNQMIRQMFQRLLIHVISQLKPAHAELYLQPFIENEEGDIDVQELGSKSCVTRFIKKMLSILEHGVRPHSKYLMEYFAFLYEFAKMGDQECFFLLHINAISTMVSFYMGQKAQENYVEILSDDEEEEEVITLTEDAYKPLSLEKMIALISLLVEKSRGEDNQLQITEKDYTAIVGGGKGFTFLFNQIRDNINVRQTCNLVFSLCRWNEALANAIIQMVFSAVKKLNPELAQPFFKFMSMLVEFVGGPPGMPPFTQYILQRYWDLTVCSPTMCLDWMANQVTRNKLANHWVLSQMDSWVENYLIKHNNVRVRNSAGVLLVSLVPSNHFRQAYRTSRGVFSPHKEVSMTNEALITLHQIYQHLLSLLPRCRLYVDPQTHGTTKLMVYFAVLQYCLISKQEKLMFGRYFNDLWQLFQPKLSEPQISMHHNKQSLLLFWYQACVDCPENVKLIVNNPHVCKHIPFTYILADHEDQDVMLFNRVTLPAYYGLLRMCCQLSRMFTRQLGQHQNILWAFKNISPYPGQYPGAVEELFRMMRLMATKHQDSTEEDIKAIIQFKHKTVQLYLANLDARSGWQTLICALKILVDTTDDRLLLIYNQGLQMLTEAFYTLHVMYHEATACHVTGDIVDLLSILVQVLKVGRTYIDQKKGPQSNEVKSCIHSWKEKLDVVKKLLTLLNSYTPPEIRSMSIDVLKEMILIYQTDTINVMVPILTQAHISFQETSLPLAVGPYFPRRGQKPLGSKSNIRPPRPQFNMLLHSNQIEASKGVDEAYDMALSDFFIPYHSMVDLMCRVAVNQQILSENIINLSAMVAFEGVPLHSPYFAKLWYEIYHSELDKSLIKMLCKSSYFMEYVDAVLLDERLSLNNQNIYQFFCNFFPKVYQQVLSEGRPLIDSLIASVTAEKSALENIKSERELMTILNRINGDLRAMLLVFSVQQPKQWNKMLYESLQYILQVCREHQQQRSEQVAGATKGKQRRGLSSQGSDEEEAAEDDGATPSKRRRVSSEGQKSDTEPTNDKQPTQSTSSETDGDEKKSDSSDSASSAAEKTVKTSPAKVAGKTGKKAAKDVGPDIKEMVGSPRPVRNESPKPGTSQENVQRQSSSEETENQPPSRRMSRQQSSGDESTNRSNVREKPSMVDHVAKHIESLFSLMSKKDGDN